MAMWPRGRRQGDGAGRSDEAGARGAPRPELPRGVRRPGRIGAGYLFYNDRRKSGPVFRAGLARKNQQLRCARGLCYFKDSGRTFQSSQDLPGSHVLRIAKAATSWIVALRSTAMCRISLCRSDEMRIDTSVLGYAYFMCSPPGYCRQFCLMMAAAGALRAPQAGPGERAHAGARTRRRDGLAAREPGESRRFFRFFRPNHEQMFVFWFKKNGFSVPFMGLKPFRMVYECGGKGFFLPAFPSPRAPYSFARVLRECVIVCITLIGEGGRAAAPPPKRGGLHYADFFGRSIAVAHLAARCIGPHSV